MEILLLKPKDDSGDAIRIYDEIITGSLDTGNVFCVQFPGGVMHTLEYLADLYQFPIKQNNTEQFEIVEYIMEELAFIVPVEFYPYEEIEF